jgi:ribosomal protein L7/L12
LTGLSVRRLCCFLKEGIKLEFRTFAINLCDSLTLEELNLLGNEVYRRREKYAKENFIPCNENEIALVREGKWIEAIKNHRIRTCYGLLESKVAVDMVRDALEKEKVK